MSDALTVVLNWIWQGSLVALLTAAVVRRLSGIRAGTRALMVAMAWFAVLALPLAAVIRDAIQTRPLAGVPAAPALVSLPPEAPSAWTPVLVWLGAAWLSLHAVGLLRAAVARHRALATSRPFPRAREARLSHWMRLRDDGRRPALVLSDHVRAAGVLGLGRPVIAVAPALLDRLTDDELDRVLVHEWAHVRRRDDLAHVARVSVHALAGWHPALRWLHRRLALEAELASDEMAAAATGSATGYAACLLKIAGLPGTHRTSLPVLAADGAGSLARRIDALVAGQPGRRPPGRVRVTAAAALVLATAGWAAGRQLVDVTELTAPLAAVVPLGGDRVRVPMPTPAAGERRAPVPPDRRPGQVGTVTRASGTPPHLPAEPVRAAESAQPPVAREVPDGTGASAIGNGDEPTFLISESATPVIMPASAPRPAAAVPTTSPVTELVNHAAASPWRSVARGGAAIGRGSKLAATATSSFFTRLGRSFGDAF
ncbi:MAG: hypothetical protein FJW23_06255 [Acidimicrobiia bacterium]|nr:hypothetical protein [Acidimicrobiia bacterium]